MTPNTPDEYFVPELTDDVQPLDRSTASLADVVDKVNELIDLVNELIRRGIWRCQILFELRSLSGLTLSGFPAPEIAALVGGVEFTGAIGGWIDPGVASEHPGRGEFEPQSPTCRSGLCDPLLCECASGPEVTHPSPVQAKVGPSRMFAGSELREDFLPGRVHRRIRFDPNVEMAMSCQRSCCVPQPDIEPTVGIGPCGEQHAANPRASRVEA